MRLVHYVLFALIAFGVAQISKAAKDEPTDNDYKAAKRYGYLKADVLEAYLEKKKTVNVDKLNAEIKKRLNGTELERAALIEDTLDAIIGRAVLVLSYEGHHKICLLYTSDAADE